MSYFQSQNQSLMPATIRITKLKQSQIAPFMSKKQKDIYQAYIIWFSRKVTQRKKTPGSHFLQSCTFGKCFPRSTKITRKSQRQPFLSSIPLCPWLSRQSNPSSPLQSESKTAQQAQQNEPRNEILGDKIFPFLSQLS